MSANEIQVGRFNALLYRLFDMKEGAPAPTLAPEVFPCIILEGPHPEHDYLKDVYHYAARGTAAAGGAGKYSSVALNNPAGSSVLVVLEHIINTAVVNFLWIGGEASPVWATYAKGIPLDSRGPQWGTGNGGSAARVLQNNTAVALPTGIGLSFYPIQGQSYELPIVLTPGNAVTISQATVNTAIDISFRWYERTLEASESR